MITLLVLLSLACYRVTRFIIADSLIDGFRERVQERLIGDNPNLIRDKIYDLSVCPYCTSVHVAWIAVLITQQFVSIPLPVLVWLAVAGGAMVIWAIVESDDDD